MEAVVMDMIDTVRSILEYGVDVNAIDDPSHGWTALTYASSTGYADIVKLLLSYGANPNTEDSDGMTPLMYASNYVYPEVVRLLVDNGADTVRLAM